MASIEQNMLHGTIAKALYARRGGITLPLSKDEMFRISESILPLYQSLILQEGFPVWSLKDGSTYRTMYEIITRTKLDRNTVLQYLATLEELAKEGVIKAQHYNPVLPSSVVTTPGQAKGVAQTIEKFMKLAIIGGIVYIAVKGISLVPPRKRMRIS